MSLIYERVIGLINEKGISQAQFCRDIGVSKNVAQNWRTSDPSLDNLIATAQYFEVSTDYLLGLTDERNKYTASKNLTAKQLELLHFFEDADLTDKQCNTIHNMVTDLRAFHK